MLTLPCHIYSTVYRPEIFHMDLGLLNVNIRQHTVRSKSCEKLVVDAHYIRHKRITTLYLVTPFTLEEIKVHNKKIKW